MNSENPDAMRRAASRFVRNQPRLFAEAVAWVESLRRMKRVSRITVGASPDFRDIEGVVLHYRGVLDKAPDGTTMTAKAAYRVILASWLLSKDGHRVDHDPARKKPWVVRPASLARLPLLTGPELRVLRGRYALESDPRWLLLARSAWDLVDPGYLVKLPATAETGASEAEASKGKSGTPAKGTMPARYQQARASLEWAYQKFPHLFGAEKNKFPKTAFLKVNDPSAGCPAYGGKKLAFSFGTWTRYLRDSAKWKPFEP
ncbi:MAG: hypothetical protein U1F29_10850 [Planctomycetota bacterium]